jgi:hypothetical protein
MPEASLPMKEEDLGGARTFFADGNAVSNSYDLSTEEDSEAVFISWSKSRAM